jgi:hypothetical protein
MTRPPGPPRSCRHRRPPGTSGPTAPSASPCAASPEPPEAGLLRHRGCRGSSRALVREPRPVQRSGGVGRLTPRSAARRARAGITGIPGGGRTDRLDTVAGRGIEDGVGRRRVDRCPRRCEPSPGALCRRHVFRRARSDARAVARALECGGAGRGPCASALQRCFPAPVGQAEQVCLAAPKTHCAWRISADAARLSGGFRLTVTAGTTSAVTPSPRARVLGTSTDAEGAPSPQCSFLPEDRGLTVGQRS